MYTRSITGLHPYTSHASVRVYTCMSHSVPPKRHVTEENDKYKKMLTLERQVLLILLSLLRSGVRILITYSHIFIRILIIASLIFPPLIEVGP
jgi:hypothetical protein